jgi:glycine cleavage system H lipoate-binding protein
MNINGFEFPEDLYYYPDEHVWIKVEGDVITIRYNVIRTIHGW